ncbi:hypothetical protein AUJ38_02300 [bacterium CG1_02_42_9]|nr:MAG: hypothetical protein AUJ38_02300 [bacterium CG1_02_42_9]
MVTAGRIIQGVDAILVAPWVTIPAPKAVTKSQGNAPGQIIILVNLISGGRGVFATITAR